MTVNDRNFHDFSPKKWSHDERMPKVGDICLMARQKGKLSQVLEYARVLAVEDDGRELKLRVCRSKSGIVKEITGSSRNAHLVFRPDNDKWSQSELSAFGLSFFVKLWNDKHGSHIFICFSSLSCYWIISTVYLDAFKFFKPLYKNPELQFMSDRVNRNRGGCSAKHCRKQGWILSQFCCDWKIVKNP